jgi:hypothetical protein
MSNDTPRIIEEYIVSLLGSIEKSCPTIWHLQKEFFIFTRMNPKAKQLFNFVKHYEGPYSETLQESVREPMYYEDAFTTKQNGEICLTNEGQKIFNDLKSRFIHNEKFLHIINSFKLIRDVYERLTKEELLFLIYITYPEYIEYSNIYDRLVGDKKKKNQLSEKLLKKGLITEERYKELSSYVAN